jgi:NADPH2:quinone reductase
VPAVLVEDPGALPSTMRAARLTAPEKMEVVTAPVPVPGPNEALVAIESCGVCASNLPPWEGRPWFSYPFDFGALGHEATGILVSHGSEFRAFEVGRRVALLSQHGYAEYDVAPAESLVPLPEALDQRLFPGEPLGCAMNIFERSQIRSGDWVAVVGVGFLGALLVQLALGAGARVIALSRSQSALDLLQSTAAHRVPITSRDETVAAVRALTGDELCAVTIEAAGKQEPLHLAGELTGIRGRLVIAGYHQDGLREINLQLWNWRGLDVINAHERDPERYRRGIQAAVGAVTSGRLDPAPLLTHRYPLEQINLALHLTRERPPGFMKAMIVL